MNSLRTEATEAQLQYIRYLMAQEGYDNDDLYNIYGKEIQDLTRKEASGMIGWLKGEAKPADNPLIRKAVREKTVSPQKVYVLDRDKTYKR
ncbi:MAG: hypothetical protein GXY80_02545 [Syntrophorhabdus aromaticivorans]|uniref:Uncharacterized protein n=1 Tax=Syntrophorhabdus aromaticivorans TaxID=328301 RepID=A0A971M1S9_9BACT|nr:hypothetical protein [Syntrophorhabdus aromaticivorans]